jgi:hypothetical protein
MDERSARRRDLYLTTHNTHNRQTSMLLAGFEPTISAGERQQTYTINRAAIGTCTSSLNDPNFRRNVWLNWFGSIVRCRKQYLSHPGNGGSTFFCNVVTFNHHALEKPKGRPLSAERPPWNPEKKSYGMKLTADIGKTAFPTIQRVSLCNVPSPTDAIYVHPTSCCLFRCNVYVSVVRLPKCSFERIQ